MDGRHRNRLEHIRRERGMKREDIAGRVGLTVRQVCNHELGRTPLSAFLIEAYARHYDVSPSDIFIAPPNGVETEERELATA